ncbi:MAG: FtsX-like permease family protein [Chloroflexota bacterium]
MRTVLGVSVQTITWWVVGGFALGFTATAILAARRPLMVRLALRNAARRPLQSLLITAGLALSTIVISTALSTGDTMGHTVRTLVAASLGRSDEIVVQPVRDARRVGFDGPRSIANGTFLTGTLTYFDESVFARLSEDLAGQEAIGGMMPSIVEETDVAAGAQLGQARLLAIPRSFPSVFGRLTSASGEAIDLARLPAGSVVLNSEAAGAVGAAPGSRLSLNIGTARIEVAVHAVARNDELGGLQATVIGALDDVQGFLGRPGQINQIQIANAGDPTTSVRSSEPVAALIRPHLVDPRAAAQIHAMLRTPTVLAELRALQAALEAQSRQKMERLVAQLELSEPSREFSTLIGDPDVERRLAAIGARIAAIEGRPGTNVLSNVTPYRVVEIKRLSQELADRWAGGLTTVFLILGLFSLATGASLVVLIFSLLAAERQADLGVLRALGAQRGTILMLLLFEGLAYSLAASAAGVAVGMGITLALVTYGGQGARELGIQLTPRFEPDSIALSYCVGTLITMVSVTWGAWRASAVSPASAIRGQAPDAAGGPSLIARLRGPAVALAGVAGAIWGGQSASAPALAGGIVAIVVGLAAAVRNLWDWLSAPRRGHGQVAYSVAGATLLTYWLAPEGLIGRSSLRPPPWSMDVLFLAGLSLIAGSVWIIAFNLRPLAGTVARIVPGWRDGIARRVGLAYLHDNPYRVGMTVGMIGLVVFSMVIAAVLLTGTHRAYSDAELMSGGYTVRIDQTIGGVPDARNALASVAPSTGLQDIGTQLSAPAEAIQPGFGNQAWLPVGLQLVDDGFTRTIRAGFDTRAEGFPTDESVWEALRAQTGTAVVAASTLRSRAGLGPRTSEPDRPRSFRIDGVWQGDQAMSALTVWIRDTRGGRAIPLRVIGVLDQRVAMGNGLLTSSQTHALTGAPSPPRATYFLRTSEKVLPADAVARANQSLTELGLRATEIGDEARKIQMIRTLLTQLLQGFIATGLLAGVAALGVIFARAVVERRRQIGMLRAIGFTRAQVRAALCTEAAAIVVCGVGLGIALGLAMAQRIVDLIARDYPEIIFRVPWDQVIGIAALASIATMAMTVGPAVTASRVRPAEAMRVE